MTAKISALQELQSQTQEELDALLPSVLDRAFKGELCPPFPSFPQIQSADLGEGEWKVGMKRKTTHSEILYLVDSIVNIKKHQEELVHVR